MEAPGNTTCVRFHIALCSQSVFLEVTKLCMFHDFFISATKCVFGIQAHGFIKILLMGIYKLKCLKCEYHENIEKNVVIF